MDSIRQTAPFDKRELLAFYPCAVSRIWGRFVLQRGVGLPTPRFCCPCPVAGICVGRRRGGSPLRRRGDADGLTVRATPQTRRKAATQSQRLRDALRPRPVRLPEMALSKRRRMPVRKLRGGMVSGGRRLLFCFSKPRGSVGHKAMGTHRRLWTAQSARPPGIFASASLRSKNAGLQG